MLAAIGDRVLRNYGRILELKGGNFYDEPRVAELELELIQTQMAQKPMLWAEVYARALRASQNVK
jgi:hypothetical protein